MVSLVSDLQSSVLIITVDSSKGCRGFILLLEGGVTIESLGVHVEMRVVGGVDSTKVKLQA